MMCRENDVRLNTDSIKWHSTWYNFGNFTIRRYDDSTNWYSTTRRFGKTTIQWNDISGKWCGPMKICKNMYSLNDFAVFQVNNINGKFSPYESKFSHFLSMNSNFSQLKWIQLKRKLKYFRSFRSYDHSEIEVRVSIMNFFYIFGVL